MKITVFKFQRVFSYCKPERYLVQNAPGLWESTKLEALQVFSAIGELKDNEVLVNGKYVCNENENAIKLKRFTFSGGNFRGKTGSPTF